MAEAPKSEPRVFISYANQDRSVAARIQQKLESSHLRTWLFHRELAAGDSVSSALQNSTRAADFVIVLLSRNSVRSHWMREELASGLHADLAARDVTILPVRIDDSQVPDALATYMWFDLRDQNEQQLQRLVSSIEYIPRIDFAAVSPRVFESMVAELLTLLHFSNVKLQGGPGDQGIDIVARYQSKDEFGKPKTEDWFVQTKYTRQDRLSLEYFRRFTADVFSRAEAGKGLFVTNGILSSVAKDFLSKAGQQTDLRVIEGPELKRLLAMHPEVTKKYFAAPEPIEENG